MPVRPTRPKALAWALLGGLPLVVLSTDGRPILLSRSIAEAAALPATLSPHIGPTITTILAVVPERISDARLLNSARPDTAMPTEPSVIRISDARLSADVSSPLPPSERVSDARVLALGSPAAPGPMAEPRFASLVTEALQGDAAVEPDESPTPEITVAAPAPSAVPAASSFAGTGATAATTPAATAAPAPVTASAVLAASSNEVAAVLPPARPGPRCDWTQAGGTEPPYQGASVSRLYDRLFKPGPAMPHLAGHVPQGLTTWRNWDGDGNTLLLLGMYRKWDDSFLVGIDPATGRHVGTVRVHESHLGGIGVIGDWLITQHTAGPSSEQAVRRYRLEALRTAMRAAVATGTRPYMSSVGDPQRINAVSFMDVAEGSLWIGRHRASDVTRMYRYTVDESGTLQRVDGPWKVPPRTQGLLVTPDHFVFASSEGLGEGRLRVYRRSPAGELGLPVACFWTPSLPQNLTEHQGKVFAAFESGAARFDRPGLRNRITHLHVAAVDAVLRAADPVALAVREADGD